MIRISAGNLGSGKTLSEVREIIKNRYHRNTYTNIEIKGIKNAKLLKSDMIIKKEIVNYHKNKKSKELEPVYKYSLNIDFWKKINEPVNVVLDEAHSILNSRRGMSKLNIILTEWLSMLRRILGENSSGYGELVLITQLPYRLDGIARDMATQVRHHICHYMKICSECNLEWLENTEMPETVSNCMKCGSYKLTKTNHSIEVIKFKNISDYEQWKVLKEKTYYSRYLIKNASKFFINYNSYQWDNMFSGF